MVSIKYLYKGDVIMPLPFILAAIAIGAGAAGIKKAVDAHDTNERANSINEDAVDIFEKAKKELESSRNLAKESLTQLGQTKVSVIQNDMIPFVKLTKKIKNINTTEIRGINELSQLPTNEILAEMQDMGSLSEQMASGIAEGTAGGALMAFGAYGAVSCLGAASTGTAIAGLSGAAATNATLAALGGGSLAAGGLGIAGGTAILGGLVAGPVLAVMGFTMNSKANENLEKARSNRAQAKKAAHEMGLASDVCKRISERADMFSDLLGRIHTKFSILLDQERDVITCTGTDYNNYDRDERDIIARAFSLAVTIKAVLDTPILNEDGSVTSKSLDVYHETINKLK